MIANVNPLSLRHVNVLWSIAVETSTPYVPAAGERVMFDILK